MAKFLVVFFLLILAAGAPVLSPPAAPLSAQGQASDAATDILTLTCVLRARNADRAKDELIALAEANQGYLLKMSERRIEVYLSRRLTAPGVLNRLSEMGQLQSRSLGKQDVAEQLRDLNTAIRVREEHLAKLQKMVEGSDVSEALELEQEVNRVITEIERNRGQLNYYRERVALMHLSVNFVQTAGTVPGSGGGVPIPWVRSLNIEDFLERF